MAGWLGGWVGAASKGADVMRAWVDSFTAHLQEVEEMDEIKAFNVKMGKVRAMKVVHLQVEEKKRRAVREKKRVTVMERRMEIDRRAEIEETFRREDMKRAKAKEAAEELQRQLEKRAFERLLEEERLEMEGQQLVRCVAARMPSGSGWVFLPAHTLTLVVIRTYPHHVVGRNRSSSVVIDDRNAISRRPSRKRRHKSRRSASGVDRS